MTPLTLAITTYNRYDMTLESFSKIVDHPRIDEILIIDDASPMDIFQKLADSLRDKPKVRLYRQLDNRGMQQNKADAVAFSKNDWVILFDSDNILSEEYINAIPEVLSPEVIYVPSFASPSFDMGELAGKMIDRHTAKLYYNLPCFGWFLNVCNYVVNREQYSKAYRYDKSIKGTDTSFFAHNWMLSGNRFFVMPGAKYEHRVHKGSEFLKDMPYNMNKANEILAQIKLL